MRLRRESKDLNVLMKDWRTRFSRSKELIRMRRQRPQKIKEEEWRLQRIQRLRLPKQPAQVQAPPENEQAQESKVTKHEMFEEQNRQPQDQWFGETHKEKLDHHMDQEQPVHLVQLQACYLLQHHQEHR